LFSQTDQYFFEVEAQCSGSTRQRISRENLSHIHVPLPKLPEQQKIADCLASLDERITLEAQKLDTLKTHKKGLMQQLFPAEGETLPKLRFPEFREAGEWCADAVDDLISTITPPKKILTSDYLSEGQFPIIDQGQSDIAGWTNDSDAIIDASQPLIVFGDHTCVLKLISRPFAQGADGIKIIQGSGLVDTNFLYQFLCFRPVVTEEYKRHFSILKTKVVAYPDRKSGEQQKIADCLSSLDDLITAQTQKLAALKTHKKGLMQQLFPVLDEVAQ
jgi:type I restriction enzyme S subunit